MSHNFKLFLSGVFALSLGALVAVPVGAVTDLWYAQKTTDNFTRPCSYRGKTSTNLTITATSAATSSALETGAVVRMVCSSAVHFRTAATGPTAVTGDTLLPANTIEWFVSEGDYVAAIRDSADGTCYLTVCR